MTLRFLALVSLLCLSRVARGAETPSDSPISINARELSAARAGFQDTPLDGLLGQAMIEATGADAALLPTVSKRARLPAGQVSKNDLLLLVPEDTRLVSTSLTGESIRAILERAAGSFAQYDFAADRPLFANGLADSAIDQFQGLSYELDLTRPAGDRVIHLAFHGESLAADRTLKVVVSERRAARGDGELSGARSQTSPLWLRDAIIAQAQRLATIHADNERSWSVLPDYAPCVERPLIDRLVREGAMSREDVQRLFPDEPARRGDLAYWLARAFGWRQGKLSGAFPDLPDSLEPWVDGLVRHRVFDVSTRTSEFFLPFSAATVPTGIEWCVNAGRARRGGPPRDAAVWPRELFAHTSLAGRTPSPLDPLTRAQALGMVANARFGTTK